MSHHEGSPPEDAYYVNPKDVLSQYSVEWISLRKSYDDIKKQLLDVQEELSRLDRRLETGELTDGEHIVLYKEKWTESTQIVQVKREVKTNARKFLVNSADRIIASLEKLNERIELSDRLTEEEAAALARIDLGILER